MEKIFNLPTSAKTLFEPPCAGAMTLPPDICPRCSASANTPCLDDEAYRAQIANQPTPIPQAATNAEIIRRVRTIVQGIMSRNSKITEEEFSRIAILVGAHIGNKP